MIQAKRFLDTAFELCIDRLGTKHGVVLAIHEIKAANGMADSELSEAVAWLGDFLTVDRDYYSGPISCTISNENLKTLARLRSYDIAEAAREIWKTIESSQRDDWTIALIEGTVTMRKLILYLALDELVQMNKLKLEPVLNRDDPYIIIVCNR